MSWIKTSDEKPELWEAVWAGHGEARYVAYIGLNEQWYMDEDGEPATTPTHWMPIPELPE